MASQIVAVKLYRRLWRWTNSSILRTSKFVMPPKLIPSLLNVTYQVQNREGIQHLIQRAFRETISTEDEKTARIDAGFEVLRGTVAINESLERLQEARRSNFNRDGIKFCIGQVIRHKKFGYRGVIVHWDRRPTVDVSNWDGVQGLPSGQNQPFYQVIPDFQDSVEFLGYGRDLMYVAQENMEAVPLEERRVNSAALEGLFEGFDAGLGRWVPVEAVGWPFPADAPRGPDPAFPYPGVEAAEELAEAEGVIPEHPDTPEALAVVSERTRTAVHSLVSKLLDDIHSQRAAAAPGAAAAAAAARPEPLRSLALMLAAVAAGRPLPPHFFDVGPLTPVDMPDPAAEAARDRGPMAAGGAFAGGWGAGGGGGGGGGYAAAAGLTRAHRHAQALSRRRRAAQRPAGVADDLHFHLGQVVRHKKFGYRGAVFGWDRRPAVNVRAWDGVVGLPSGENQPFYYIIPDEADAMDSLTGSHAYRYVAQENILPCPSDESHITSSYTKHAFESFDVRQMRYIPRRELRYKFPGHYHSQPEKNDEDAKIFAETDGVINSILKNIESFYKEAAQERYSGLIPDLFFMLKNAPKRIDADLVEALIYQCWAYNMPEDARQQHELGTLELKKQSYGAAIMNFNELLGKYSELPLAADVHQKLATCHFLMGRYEKSLEHSCEAIQLDSQNYQALITAGEACISLHRFHEGIEYFLRAAAINPWADVGGSLMKARVTVAADPHLRRKVGRRRRRRHSQQLVVEEEGGGDSSNDENKGRKGEAST